MDWYDRYWLGRAWYILMGIINVVLILVFWIGVLVLLKKRDE